ncbi:MAG TPA: methyltransferase [Actinomycetota bacterium]|nr:methyltransferase [Actinomycetota bacterium]
MSGGALLPGGGRDAGGRAARGTAFEQVYGDRFFDYLARHPEQEATFQASMSGRAEQEAGDVVAAYDFGGLGRLVDVGGGYGILLGAVLRATRELQAVLLSRVLHDGSTTTPAACWPPAGRRWPRRAGC